MNKIIRNVSQILKIKQEKSVVVVPPVVNNSVNFIRSCKRYTIFDYDLNLIRISQINKSLSPHKGLGKTPSPGPSLTSSPMREKWCKKISDLVSNIETFQNQSRVVRKTAAQDQISLKHKQEFKSKEKNRKILKKFHKNLVKVRKN